MVFFPFLRVQRYIFFPYKACFYEKYFIWCMIFCFLMIDILCHKFQVSGFRFQVSGFRFQVSNHKSQITNHKSQITSHKKIVSLPPRNYLYKPNIL